MKGEYAWNFEFGGCFDCRACAIGFVLIKGVIGYLILSNCHVTAYVCFRVTYCYWASLHLLFFVKNGFKKGLLGVAHVRNSYEVDNESKGTFLMATPVTKSRETAVSTKIVPPRRHCDVKNV